jgi:2-amino-4-hydroxy-6-hydroxymethyldihydropteridine diphosphokinase
MCLIINTLVLRKMKRIFLSLGSNLGNREQHLEQALFLIQSRIGPLERVSRIYESEPWGYSSTRDFYNCCVALRTNLAPGELMELLLDIEKQMGRQRKSKAYSDRIIDIDLLLYEDRQISQPGLTVPHPSMAGRRFVLAPLAEIAADIVHPLSGKSIRKMLEDCEDPSELRPVAYKFFSRSSSQNM